ncbi:hypothetical protein Ddye_008114 [Dipteronia dyeriana]|uniref:Myb/SANT-like domain-containing protein n=1 Tax=Dipteronia dyeriana TaxID=168575 RepID=A0AAE0CL03_9ROSI|nr:hypothetical protein Ddye_008114 [Dipteronia dyeriana]
MLNTSGFGWDDTRKCVTMDDPEILTEYLKKHHNKNYTANRPFPHYEQLVTVFGKDRATRQTSNRKRTRNVSSTVADITKVFEKSMERASADIAKLTEAITGGDAMTRLGVELEGMCLDRVQVIRVVMYFGNKTILLHIWNGLNDSYKPDFVNAI